MYTWLLLIVLALSNSIWSAENSSPDFPDPMILKASDGYYYAYGTGLKVTRSKDLLTWESPWDPMPDKPRWGDKWNKYWAPHVIEHRKRFYLYYSAQPDWSEHERMRLGVAIGNSPGGPFKDIGRPIDTGDAEENIDPMVFKDTEKNKFYLYWGRNGIISVQELAQDLVSFREGTLPLEVLQPGRRDYEEIIEAPFLFKQGKNYYLFYSGDDCCVRPRYAVSVAVGQAPLGPFQKLDSYSLQGTAKLHNPGHNAIFLDRHGMPQMVYHVVDKRRERHETGHIYRVMRISPLRTEKGIPFALINESVPLIFKATEPEGYQQVYIHQK